VSTLQESIKEESVLEFLSSIADDWWEISAILESQLGTLIDLALPIASLSGGELTKLFLAIGLAQNPRVLLLDEPTAFLDLQHQVGICSVLLRLKEERRLTVVLVSHDLNLVSQYCDRILLLDRGQVVRLGRPEEVIEPGVLESVYRCRVLVDGHPGTGLPRVTLPGRSLSGGM